MSYLDTLAATLSPLAAVLPILPLLPLLLAAALLTVGAMAADRSESWIALSDRYTVDPDTIARRLSAPVLARPAARAVATALRTGRPDLASRANRALLSGHYRQALSLAGAAVRHAPRPVAVPVPTSVPSAPMSRPALFERPVFLLVPVAPVAPVARQAA